MVERLRRFALVNPPTPQFDQLTDSAEVPFLPLEAIWPGTGLDASRRRSKSEVSTGYTRFLEGDILVPKITPTFQADRTVIATGIEGGVGVATTEVHIVRVNGRADRGYVRYLFSTKPFLTEGEAAMTGVAGQRRVPDELLRNLVVPVTDIRRQRAIAEFLERQTARIDALIAARGRMIRLLNERYAAWRDKVLVSDAEVTWIPLHHLTDPRRPIVYGIVQAGEEVPDGIPYIKSGDVSDFNPDRLSRTSQQIHAAYRRARVQPGDIVIAMRASIGLAIMVPDRLPEANLTQGTARIAARKGVNRNWLLHVLATRVVQEQCQVRAVGTTFKTLNIWDLRRLSIPTPTEPEQQRLAEVIASASLKFSSMTAGLLRQIDLLSERRQAMITNAVTGQVQIEGMVAS